MDLFLTNTQILASQDFKLWTGGLWIPYGLLWCFYQLFGQLFAIILTAPIHCRGSIGEQVMQERKKLVLDSLRIHTFSANLTITLTTGTIAS